MPKENTITSINCKDEISSNLIGESSTAGKSEDESVVTDAVHERFKEIHVFCNDCKIKVIGNDIEIKKHFNALHPSDELCVYCNKKVYRYYSLNSQENTKERGFVFHECNE
ncbi:uncharacterized protein LOC127286824 [Leptopilina boulardi]|uniref:uncharacterized protein LOC127286824 n=1 Tax=Leptopilina boulardi TaxID=63433 RepID=UPI0021F61DF0|nr:uncharacterized protein LOC127286824 [Leptopilina boulardi]